MGFYGNITNTSRTQFQFDRTYPNRYSMDLNKNTDGVYIGRYVLVEYDKTMGADWAIVAYKATDENGIIRFYTSADKEQVTEITYLEKYRGRYIRIPGKRIDINGQDIYYNLDDPDVLVDIIYRIDGPNANSDGALQVTLISELENNAYNENYRIDNNEYGPSRGYDSTVWQKVYVDNQERYVMIAELNTVVPTFGVSADAPTMSPITPHFDADSTNVYYKLHWQPSWGLRVRSASPKVLAFPMDNQGNSIPGSQVNLSTPLQEKLPSDELVAWSRSIYDTSSNSLKKFYYDFAINSETWELKGRWAETAAPNDNQYMPAAIYYNKDGFNPAIISYSDDSVIDRIAIEATGLSGNLYNVHGIAGKQEAQVDTQELSIMLPSLGNSIAKIWDLVYGNEEINGSKTRNMFIDWEEGTLVPQLKGLRLVETKNNGYSLKKNNVQTLAGAINSVHDLMGMIIQEKDEITLDKAQEDVANWLDNYIYYLSSEGKFYRKSKGYKFTEDSGYSPDKHIPYSPIAINGNWSFPNEYFYLDYVPSNPKQGGDKAIPYPNYMKEKKAYYPDRTYYKTAGPKAGVNGFKGSQFMESFKAGVYYEPVQIKLSGAEEIPTISYRISLDKEYDSKKTYYNISHESLGDNFRFWTKNSLYIGNFERKEDHTQKDYEDGVLFIFDETTNKYTRPTSYDPANIYYSASFMEDDANNFDGSKQYFTVSTVEKEDKTVYIERIRYVEERGLSSTDFLLYDYYYKVDGVYYLAEYFDSNQTYYRKIVTLEPKKENVNSASPENINEIDVVSFDSYAGKVAVYKKGGAGGANGFNEYVLLTEKMLNTHTENLVTITATAIENVYVPFLYYREVTNIEDPYYGSYIIDTSSTCDKEAIYYEKDQMTYGDVINAIVEGERYIPGKFYYKVSEKDKDDEYILDTSKELTVGREYYKKNSLYVLSDSSGRFNYGVEWNLNVEKPKEVKLAKREEIWELQELKGFARNYNTIHGLILRLNQILDLDNPESRNLDTIQGALNSIRDVLGYLHNIKPNELLVTDDYGRFTTTKITTDEWLETAYSDDSNITFKHLYLGDDTIPSGSNGITVNGESTDKNLTFGGSFISPTFTVKTDSKGHLNSFSNSFTTLTMPTLSFTTVPPKENDNGNVIIDMNMSAGTGVNQVTFTETRENVGNLLLTDYTNPGSNEKNVTSITNSDSINEAFGRIEKVLKDISGDEWINPVIDNGSIKFEHNNTGTVYEKPITMHEKKDKATQLVFGGEIASPYISIAVDEAGHIDSYETGDNTLTLPTLKFTEATKNSGNVITGLSMTGGDGAEAEFKEERSYVGSLGLTGYILEKDAKDVTKISSTDSINNAFVKINTLLASYNYELEEKENVYISSIKQVDGKIEATSISTTNITQLGTIEAGEWKGTPISTDYISDDAITGAKISEGTITESHFNGNIVFDATKVAGGSLALETLSNTVNVLLSNYKNPLTDEEGNEVPIENLNILPEDSILMALIKLEQRIQTLEKTLNPPAE